MVFSSISQLSFHWLDWSALFLLVKLISSLPIGQIDQLSCYLSEWLASYWSDRPAFFLLIRMISSLPIGQLISCLQHLISQVKVLIMTKLLVLKILIFSAIIGHIFAKKLMKETKRQRRHFAHYSISSSLYNVHCTLYSVQYIRTKTRLRFLKIPTKICHFPPCWTAP